MSPTLKDGEIFSVEKSPSHLKRGDIVVYLHPADKTKRFVKRIIGLPGERIAIRDNEVFINGEPLVEAYLEQNLNQNPEAFDEHTIPAGSYFVMGDNRDNSLDSRRIGDIKVVDIIGKVSNKR